MPRESSSIAKIGVCTEKKVFGSSPRAIRIRLMPASTIMPATMPPRNR